MKKNEGTWEEEAGEVDEERAQVRRRKQGMVAIEGEEAPEVEEAFEGEEEEE